jgi:ribosome biogenesis GTPase
MQNKLYRSGLIVRALSGFYDVKLSDGATLRCRARGVFRNTGESPVVGDHVDVTDAGHGEGVIYRIKPRSSLLVRPPVANMSQVLWVFSIKEPEWNPFLLDKFLTMAELQSLKSVILVSKIDLLDTAGLARLEEEARLYTDIGYPFIPFSSISAFNIQRIREVMKGEMNVLAGQSGVGKTSLLNRLFPSLRHETAAISQKLGRGKHTTRHVELLPLEEGGYVADTPGFGELTPKGIEIEQLASLFVEFNQYAGSCRFRSCLHVNEPGCAVCQAVAEQLIHPRRHEHYLHLLNEIREKRRK